MSKKKNVKSVAIRFVPQSDETELYCKDGEIAGWTEEKNTDKDDDKKNDATETNTVIQGVGGEILASMPPGFVPLCIHHDTIIAKTTSGSLYAITGVNFTERNLIAGWSEDTFGRLIRALCYDNIVTLIGSKRLAWLIADTSTGKYSLRTTLPGAPECTLAMTRVALPPYMNSEDDDVTLAVSVALGENMIAEGALSGWMTGSDSHAVNEDIRQKVCLAVAQSVEQYLSAVREAGLTTAPVRGFASLSGRLPGPETTIGTYSRPTLILYGWTYVDGILRMSLRLSAVPYRPYVNVQVTQDNVRWSDIFPRAEVALSSEIAWWKSSSEAGVTVADMINVNIEGQRRRGFNLFAISADEYNAALLCKRDYRYSGSISASTAVEGVMSLRRDITAPIVTPDYSDHDRLKGDGGVATAEGPVLFAGNCILTADRQFPVLYPSRRKIADARVIALSESFRSRRASAGGRTPLLAFCSDGVRLISEDSAGGYGLNRLVSRDVPVGSRGVAVAASSVVALTPAGLVEIKGTTRKLICSLAQLDIGVTADMYSAESSCSMGYSYTGDFVVMTGVGGDEGDSVGRVYRLSDALAGRLERRADYLMEYEGRLWGVDEHRHIEAIALLESVSDGSDGLDGSDGSDGSVVSGEFCTRALKLGDLWTRKRVYHIDFGEETVSWWLDGSEDGRGWVQVCHGEGWHTGALHLPAFRVWRLRLSCRHPDTLTGCHITAIFP